MKTVLIYSGGMDSTSLLYRLLNQGEQVECLNFFYGSKHNHQERKAALAICEMNGIPIHLIQMDFINRLFKSDLLSSGGEVPHGHYAAENMKKTVVPFRNGIMLSIATGFAASIGFDQVALGVHAGDHTIYPDCRWPFITAMEDAVREGLWENVGIHVPYIQMTKGEIAVDGIKNGALLNMTYSCYEGGDKHCGKCGACTERKEAFEFAGRPEWSK